MSARFDFSIADRKPSMAIVSCNNGEMTYLGHPLDQSSYGCLAPPKSYSRKTQILCYDKLHMYKVGFWHPTAERIWTNLYDVCVDDTEPQLIKTKYVIHTIQKGVAFRQEYSRFMNHKTQVGKFIKLFNNSYIMFLFHFVVCRGMLLCTGACLCICALLMFFCFWMV